MKQPSKPVSPSKAAASLRRPRTLEQSNLEEPKAHHDSATTTQRISLPHDPIKDVVVPFEVRFDKEITLSVNETLCCTVTISFHEEQVTDVQVSNVRKVTISPEERVTLPRDQVQRLLLGAAHCYTAAAELLSIPGTEMTIPFETLVKQGRELAAMAIELGKPFNE